ncbi:amidohydrolase family protein [Rariglobus hedericola]|uniref:Amidohydrolase family protein n=1 Tax=Rariglobus hedericola TaxID=2597822 RepID=A0A556QQ55_9BACT|nr:amidohydrolase family protein [Rariglobus hedericola]TSJ78778.1 amidohydrolase family protein [Rariglobus hedericola]
MRIDCHVHVVGTGTSGTGCWYRPRGLTRIGAPFLVRAVGLTMRDLHGPDFDRIYAERLLAYVQGAPSIDRAMLLAHELPYRDDGTPLPDRASFYVSNDHVLDLAQKHPEFLAGVSIHPSRRDAFEELEKCLTGGAAALKCLPNVQGIDWNDPRHTRFLELMAEAGLPLLAHTGSERTMPVMDAKLASPRVLTRPLEIGVTCIAAHCGTGMMLLDPDYLDVFVEMTERFPNLYGDNSALAALNFRLRPSALRRLKQGALAERILHGSDLPVPSSGLLPWAGGMLSWRAHRETARIKNPLERDAKLKEALGFSPDTFTRAGRVLRLPTRA